MNQTQNMAVI